MAARVKEKSLLSSHISLIEYYFIFMQLWFGYVVLYMDTCSLLDLDFILVFNVWKIDYRNLEKRWANCISNRCD